MSARTVMMTDDLYRYYAGVGFAEAEPLRRLRAETEATQGARAGMLVSPEQGAFMGLLIRITGARRLLEIGTFTGYSALACLLAMPEDGRILCCDVSEAWTAVARRHWAEAGVAEQVDLRLGPAIETLDALLAAGAAGTFDQCFVDADKDNYDDYYERALRLVRPGGLVLIDNVLWDGAVADPADTRPSTLALRALNAKIASDGRVERCMVPIGDGLTIVRTADGRSGAA